ncbi:hypothetical protein [Ensifer adhaerens]|uniref:hypothetical protein n=1 Tax=Ensifer adhaerens TaxID=106592 RepID=UPI0015693653
MAYLSHDTGTCRPSSPNDTAARGGEHHSMSGRGRVPVVRANAPIVAAQHLHERKLAANAALKDLDERGAELIRLFALRLQFVAGAGVSEHALEHFQLIFVDCQVEEIPIHLTLILQYQSRLR